MIEMAFRPSACPAAVAAPPHLGFQPQNHPRITLKPSPRRIPPRPLSLRLNDSLKVERRLGFFALFASNSDPSSGDSITKTSDASKSDGTAQGPPFLTILAGFVVFFLISWILGSLILWLIGLIVKLPPK